MKNPIVIHPFLFAIYPLFFLFSHNIEQISFIQILIPLTIILCLIFLLVFLSRIIFRDKYKTAVIISVAIILFFSYGHIYNLIMDLYIGSFEIGRHRYLWFTWALLFTFTTYQTLRTQRSLHKFTNILNIIALSLFIFSIFNIGIYEFKTVSNKQDNFKSMDIIKATNTTAIDVPILRDIYYIILDGYASSNTLRDVYNFDNQNFTSYLKSKDFYIAHKSRSNYPLSFLSIASSLNMKYLNYLTDVIGQEGTDPTLPYHLIQNSQVMGFLKKNGYKYVHFSSGYGPTNRNKYADLDIHGLGLGSEFISMVAQTTMLKTFDALILGFERKKILDTFSKLGKIHQIEGPKFIFAHIVSPHHPYLFDKNGEPVPSTSLKMKEGTGIWEQRENYINQLIFINKKVQKLIEDILLKSKIPPIIIIQADHGSASSFSGHYGSESWKHPSETMLKERMRILNTYYLPLNGTNLLYESITPVNTFRLVFDFYFNTNYGLIDDESYYSSYGRPYKFTNVTDSVTYK